MKSTHEEWNFRKLMNLYLTHLTYILLTSHSGFFFFLFVALLACLLATYLTARRGRMLWSPTRNPLVAIFIFDFPPSKWNPVSSGQIRNEADLPSRGCPVVWSWTKVTSLNKRGLRLHWDLNGKDSLWHFRKNVSIFLLLIIICCEMLGLCLLF